MPELVVLVPLAAAAARFFLMSRFGSVKMRWVGTKMEGVAAAGIGGLRFMPSVSDNPTGSFMIEVGDLLLSAASN